MRKRIGTIGALSGAGLIAISPGAVYLSRYFIHESLFVFFTLGIVVAALKFYDSGRAAYLILASISAALMVATKEDLDHYGPVLLIALVTTSVYFWLREKIAGKQSEHLSANIGGKRSNVLVGLFPGYGSAGGFRRFHHRQRAVLFVVLYQLSKGASATRCRR